MVSACRTVQSDYEIQEPYLFRSFLTSCSFRPPTAPSALNRSKNPMSVLFPEQLINSSFPVSGTYAA